MRRVALALMMVGVACLLNGSAWGSPSPAAAPVPQGSIIIKFPDGRRVVSSSTNLADLRRAASRSANAISAPRRLPAAPEAQAPDRPETRSGAVLRTRRTGRVVATTSDDPASVGRRGTLLLSGGPEDGRDTDIGDAWDSDDEDAHQRGQEGGEGGQEGGEGGEDDPPAPPDVDPPAPLVIPTILPGNGFGDDPVEPNPAHVLIIPGLAGGDDKAIARWNVVPYQDITEPIDIGIVAFHTNGIRRVEFYLDNGPPAVVTSTSLNPRTNTWEYVARVDPGVSGMPVGFAECRAIIYPIVGEPRVLAGPLGPDVTNGEYSLWMTIDGNSELSRPIVWVDSNNGDDENLGTEEEPVRTASRGMRRAFEIGGEGFNGADGAIVYLKAGRYEWGPPIGFQGTTTLRRWATITAAPGVDREDVVFDRRETHIGFKTDLVRIKNITIDASSGIDTPLTTSGSWNPTDPAPRLIWVDECVLIGPGMATGTPIGGFDYIFATDSIAYDWFRGWVYCELTRNCNSWDIGEQAFTGSRMVVNGKVRHIRFGHADAHPDVWFPGDVVNDNVILYGIEALDIHAQGIAWNGRTDGPANSGTNMAFVNILIEAAPDVAVNSQWEDIRAEHILLWHVSLPNSSWLWRFTDRPGYVMRMDDISVRNCVFFHLGVQDFSIPDDWYHNNHFINNVPSNGTLTPGTSPTAGPIEWGSGYTPLLGSPIADRVVTDIVPADLRNQRVHPTDGARGDLGAIQAND